MSKYEALFHEQLEDIKLIFDKIAIFVGLNIKFILILFSNYSWFSNFNSTN